mmetsp:Transcript_19260/g.60582  ORF Transcript_19260/g.60582 Transcript_19260/m.60582 type:complete len:342 (+) Transcript_19260:482-1507(+)|eukprot:scaffold5375_cov110-Isochrysis_galbana.AAC.4
MPPPRRHEALLPQEDRSEPAARQILGLSPIRRRLQSVRGVQPDVGAFLRHKPRGGLTTESHLHLDRQRDRLERTHGRPVAAQVLHQRIPREPRLAGANQQAKRLAGRRACLRHHLLQRRRARGLVEPPVEGRRGRRFRLGRRTCCRRPVRLGTEARQVVRRLGQEAREPSALDVHVLDQMQPHAGALPTLLGRGRAGRVALLRRRLDLRQRPQRRVAQTQLPCGNLLEQCRRPAHRQVEWDLEGRWIAACGENLSLVRNKGTAVAARVCSLDGVGEAVGQLVHQSAGGALILVAEACPSLGAEARLHRLHLGLGEADEHLGADGGGGVAVIHAQEDEKAQA